jgi:hypothetical protein
LGYRIGHPARHNQLQRQRKCERLPLVVFSEGLSPKGPWARADTDMLSSTTFEDDDDDDHHHHHYFNTSPNTISLTEWRMKGYLA